MKRKNTDWHVAMTSAIRIDLRDYADILDFDTEVPIWDKKFRLDMIIIKKISDRKTNNPLIQNFCPVNLFEIKGIGSSISISVFYKAIAYAGLYASERSTDTPLLAPEISVNLMSRGYPKKLIHFLRSKCKSHVEKLAPGVYHVDGFGFPIHIIITRQISRDTFLYLACATGDLGDNDIRLIEKLETDIVANRHLEPQIYDDYIHQLSNAYSTKKGAAAMAITKKVKSIYDMNLSELSRENARQKEIYDMNLSELSRENARQKELYDREKEFYDLTLSELSKENEQNKKDNDLLKNELNACKELIEKLQKEIQELKQRQ